MQKRRVIMFFLLLMLFSALLFIVQMTYFGSLTGSVVADETSYSGGQTFGMVIHSIDISQQLNVKVDFSSKTYRQIAVNYYVTQNGVTVYSDNQNVSVNGNAEVAENLQLQPFSGPIALVVYATDGISDIRLVKTVRYSGLTGNAVDGQQTAVESMPLALLTGGVLLLLIILIGLIVSRHKKYTKRLDIQPQQKRFIRLDIK